MIFLNRSKKDKSIPIIINTKVFHHHRMGEFVRRLKRKLETINIGL
jgi:hypothetical protein